MPVQWKWPLVIFDNFSIFNGGRIHLIKCIYLPLVSVGSHSSNAEKKNVKNVYFMANFNNAIHNLHLDLPCLHMWEKFLQIFLKIKHLHIELDPILSCNDFFFRFTHLNQQVEFSLKSQEIHFAKVSESCVHETRAMTYFWCETNFYLLIYF